MKLRGSAIIALAVVLMVGINSASTGQKGDTATPKQVFVVNTGEGTVSLVDLTTMKEVEKYKVGSRPYGHGRQSPETCGVHPCKQVNPVSEHSAGHGDGERFRPEPCLFDLPRRNK
jgi:YVTN family beta-propeller protein